MGPVRRCEASRVGGRGPSWGRSSSVIPCNLMQTSTGVARIVKRRPRPRFELPPGRFKNLWHQRAACSAAVVPPRAPYMLQKLPSPMLDRPGVVSRKRGCATLLHKRLTYRWGRRSICLTVFELIYLIGMS